MARGDWEDLRKIDSGWGAGPEGAESQELEMSCSGSNELS